MRVRYLTLKVKSDNMPETVKAVETVWKQIVPTSSVPLQFLDDDFNKQYQADFTFRRLFTTFFLPGDLHRVPRAS